MAGLINNYLSVSVADFARMGYLKPNAVTRGVVTISTNGEPVARFGVEADTTATPVIRLTYTYGDTSTPKTTEIRLSWQPSNLSTTSGYYYFVCPVTGRLCRKLYIVDGLFISRRAFRPMYAQQVKSRAERDNALFRAIEAITAAEQIEREQVHHRRTYRGKPTRWQKHCEQVNARCREIYREWMNGDTSTPDNTP